MCILTYSLCLSEFGILLVAVSCPQGQGGKFRVNPGKNFIIQQGYVGFFIAQGPNEVRRQVTDDEHDQDDDDIHYKHKLVFNYGAMIPAWYSF